jgi:hypothetical protein
VTPSDLRNHYLRDVRRASIALICASLPALLVACGNSRTPPPRVTVPQPPVAAIPQDFMAQGISLAAPSNWTIDTGRAPLIEQITSGPGLIAIWRFPRTEPLPSTVPQLRLARHYLVGAAKVRDPSINVTHGIITHIDRRPAVELLGQETVDGQLRSMRSTHVYTEGSEYVIDALAPPADFATVDRTLFRPLLRSLRFARPQ